MYTSHNPRGVFKGKKCSFLHTETSEHLRNICTLKLNKALVIGCYLSLVFSAQEGPLAGSRGCCLCRWPCIVELAGRQVTTGKAKGKLPLTSTYCKVLGTLHCKVLGTLQLPLKNVSLCPLNR